MSRIDDAASRDFVSGMSDIDPLPEGRKLRACTNEQLRLPQRSVRLVKQDKKLRLMQLAHCRKAGTQSANRLAGRWKDWGVIT